MIHEKPDSLTRVLFAFARIRLEKHGLTRGQRGPVDCRTEAVNGLMC